MGTNTPLSTTKKNKIIEQLLSQYEIETVLAAIMEKYPNESVISKAEELLELISNNAW